MKHVGIVILNYNSSEYLKICLDSIVKAQTNVRFSIGVIDNGSVKQDEQKAKRYFEKYVEVNGYINGFYIASTKNLGFSAGNNVVISKFLEDSSVTHICLLNADVLVSDYWLDYLLREECSVIGPVTNAAGNEQTVHIDYKVSANLSALEHVKNYAMKRYAAYGDYRTTSDLLYFFNVLIDRKVIEKIGLLDEQFYPGSFEDNDYCIRILNAGYQMTIARGCFVHHYGSGSFSKLDMPKRIEISNINRQRFEIKWGIKWKEIYSKLLASCKQDINCFIDCPTDSWAISLINRSLQDLEKMIDDWADAIAFYKGEQYIGQVLREHAMNSNQQESEAPELPRQIISLENLCGRQMLRLASIKAMAKARKILKLDAVCLLLKHKKKETDKDAAKLSASIDERKNDKGCVCIFAPLFNAQNERDGYFQRIRAIDETILADFLRIYLCDDGIRRTTIEVSFVDRNHISVLFNSHDRNQRMEVFGLLCRSKVMYAHSLLPFMTDRIHVDMCNAFALNDVKKIWDVHGSVPEEYLLSGSEIGCKVANDVEKFLYYHSDIIITVTAAMLAHLQNKYGESSAEFVVLPIFNQNIRQAIDCTADKVISDGKAIVVYSGGLQSWQNICMMQDIMEKTMQRYHYKILVPDINLFIKLWGNRSKMHNVTLDSKTPDQMGNEYCSCHYGLVLRDDIVVNNVACPTKIIEYIQYGIVPIYKTGAIGDFVKFGLKFISYEDFISGSIPAEADRLEMAKHNYGVLSKLAKDYEDGYKKLFCYLNS